MSKSELKAYDAESPTYTCFLDGSKNFDKVNH